MKTKQLFFTGVFLAGTFFANAQTTITTTNMITRVGLETGASGSGNAFFGYRAGALTPQSPIGFSNTFIGHKTGENYLGSYNVFIGNNCGNNVKGSRNIFIGVNAGTFYTSTISDKLVIDNSSTDKPLIWGDFAEDLLKFNGKVGIGYDFGIFPTTAGSVNVSAYNLFVNGGILTEEVRVMLKTQWADYVFEESYNLPNLEEVEQFIKENKHLPNVPSAKEVAQNGIELGEMAKIQQEKIEELTLYIIEQNKINKEQQREIDELKEQVRLLLENQNR